MLHPSQSSALSHISSYARTRRAAARETIDHVGTMCNLSPAAIERAVACVRQHAQIALHFHPDRPDAQHRTVAASLLDCGIYKSQFETLLSNGSVSAFAGGARDLWEQRLFGGAYQLPDTTAALRPKYGSLDLMRHAAGPSPRFGSCFFLLSPAVSARATYTYLDSYQDPPEKGTFEEFDDILAALLAETFTREHAIGEPALTPGRLIQQLATLDQPFADPSGRAPTRNLNHYVEAQVHGDVRLADDVDLLVADPSFQGTEVGRTLESLCERYQIRCFWHPGYTLPATAVPPDFRGPAMPSLAARIASDGWVDAAAIGRAAMALQRDPSAWADRGAPGTVLQELKLLWHVLVRFGHPHASRQVLRTRPN